MKVALAVFCSIILCAVGRAQLMTEKPPYTRADTLRGALRKERHFDVKEYRLQVAVNPEERYLSGVNRIYFVPEETLPTIQIDLFENLKVDSIMLAGSAQQYKREYNAVFINFETALPAGKEQYIDFYYSGNPTVAKMAPWDGGVVFSQDEEGRPWIATACQGIGASIWYPNKDHQSDEPDRGATISIDVPKGLTGVSNGRLLDSEALDNGYIRWTWKVVNPINNYDIALNIGNYAHFGKNYKGLDLDYYVLKDHLEIAKRHFEKEVQPMLDCFQEKFGEYPFKEDGYKIVETPFLGMEHQSAIAYGNGYSQGYLGRDLSQSGIGYKWDYIIVHESGHEWFGNSITAGDIADMWIHESFTTYAESVYVECRWGYDEAQAYINGSAGSVLNDRPIVGDYGVNSKGSGDMYFKGAMMLNTIRHIINNDPKWWSLLKNYSLHFKKQIIAKEDVINFFEKESKTKLRGVFLQYLEYTSLPILQWKQKGSKTYYRWKTDVKDFEMPIEVSIKNETKRLRPTKRWKSLSKTNLNDVRANTSKFYIKEERVSE